MRMIRASARAFGPGLTRRLCAAFLALSLLAGCGTTLPVTPEPLPPPKASVVETARGQLGAPYRAGGDSPRSGFDCSGLVQWCYAVQGHKLPRRTEDMLKVGRPVDKADLKPGDLVFFNVTRKRWGLHVGIYTGRGRFIHSPTPGAHVREESLAERYWVRTYIGARRVQQ
ncbi:Murein DD-endopeptidase MepH [Fundidesulfovibrio magnetotacticus]|uniref:Murein DD-endopeptidase MepH n=1 Tax=Fundidesulfovibrio magnetotacticus TaxID=2730080 RepID=A0A6V8LUM5_9BACT|nr:C40 family peptidase [Fundidesulfovibrio magnetotacticus]GFK94018.1 Murein DD-endopeptidase MepH [Fundidesulfovibrio magnetotacticus]